VYLRVLLVLLSCGDMPFNRPVLIDPVAFVDDSLMMI